MNFKFGYILLFLFCSCENVELPKPNAYLRLDFPSPTYKEIAFEPKSTIIELNTASTLITDIKVPLMPIQQFQKVFRTH